MCKLSKVLRYRHDIDWLNIDNRKPYYPEITTASKEIFNPGTTAGIIVMGFSGFYSSKPSDKTRVEELVPVLKKIAKKGEIPIWVVNTREQCDKMKKRGDKHFLRNIIKNFENVYIMEPIDDTLHIWLGDVLYSAGLDIHKWELDYKNKWIKNKVFMARNIFIGKAPK